MAFSPSLVKLHPIIRGGQAMVGFGQSKWVNARVLSPAGAAETIGIPTGAAFVNLAANGDFYANFNATAVVPAADDDTGVSAIFKPGLRSLDGCTGISVISPTSGATVVTAEFFK